MSKSNPFSTLSNNLLIIWKGFSKFPQVSAITSDSKKRISEANNISKIFTSDGHPRSKEFEMQFIDPLKILSWTPKIITILIACSHSSDKQLNIFTNWTFLHRVKSISYWLRIEVDFTPFNAQTAAENFRCFSWKIIWDVCLFAPWSSWDWLEGGRSSRLRHLIR